MRVSPSTSNEVLGHGQQSSSQAKVPTVEGALAFLKSAMKEAIAGVVDGTDPGDAAFSLAYPNDGSWFSRKSDAEAAAKAIRGKGNDSYVVADGPHQYHIVINN
jgi:hypothetical protein